MGQYKQYKQEDDLGAAIWGFIVTVGLWLLFILGGLWIISKWLTDLLFRYVLNPLLAGALDRHDGLVVLCAAGLWGVVAGIVFPIVIDPYLALEQPLETTQAWLGAVGLGMAWGTSIGFWLVVAWWSEVTQAEPALHFTELSGLPPAFYEPVPEPDSNNNAPDQPELTLDELEQRMFGSQANETQAQQPVAVDERSGR